MAAAAASALFPGWAEWRRTQPADDSVAAYDAYLRTIGLTREDYQRLARQPGGIQPSDLTNPLTGLPNPSPGIGGIPVPGQPIPTGGAPPVAAPAPPYSGGPPAYAPPSVPMPSFGSSMSMSQPMPMFGAPARLSMMNAAGGMGGIKRPAPAAPAGMDFIGGSQTFQSPTMELPPQFLRASPQRSGPTMPMVRDRMMGAVMAPFQMPNWGIPQVNPAYLTQQMPLPGGATPANAMVAAPQMQIPAIPTRGQATGLGYPPPMMYDQIS